MTIDQLGHALADSYRQLRAVKTVADEGWCAYVAGEPAEAACHVVDIAHPPAPCDYRTLLREELFWWSQGLADGWGHGHVVAALTGQVLPDLVTVAEAARMLISHLGQQMSAGGIRYLIGNGDLYPIFAAHRRRLFADQVRALGAARTGAADAEQQGQAWQRIREQLPPVIRPANPAELTPRPSPDPLPVPAPAGTKANHRRRRVQALRVGEKAGWFRFLASVPDGFLVDVGAAEPRRVPHVGVLAYVLGVGDRHGQGALVAYRDGLG